MYTVGEKRVALFGGGELWPILDPDGKRIATITGPRGDAEDVVQRLNSRALSDQAIEHHHELPFKLPVRLEGHTHGNLCLVAADSELICVLQAATAEEAEAIAFLINKYGE